MNDIITAVLIVFEAASEKIREEQELKYKEDHGQLNKDNDPQAFAGGHLPEPVIIK